MREVIFVDTAGWIALGNKDDRWHREAMEADREMRRRRARRITTDAVLVEIGNSLCKLPLRSLAIALIEEIRRAERLGLVEIVHVDRELLEQGFVLFQNRPDKEWSLTDCISFTVMQKRGIGRALTTDHHLWRNSAALSKLGLSSC